MSWSIWSLLLRSRWDFTHLCRFLDGKLRKTLKSVSCSECWQIELIKIVNFSRFKNIPERNFNHYSTIFYGSTSWLVGKSIRIYSGEIRCWNDSWEVQSLLIRSIQCSMSTSDLILCKLKQMNLNILGTAELHRTEICNVGNQIDHLKTSQKLQIECRWELFNARFPRTCD